MIYSLLVRLFKVVQDDVHSQRKSCLQRVSKLLHLSNGMFLPKRNTLTSKEAGVRTETSGIEQISTYIPVKL